MGLTMYYSPGYDIIVSQIHSFSTPIVGAWRVSIINLILSQLYVILLLPLGRPGGGLLLTF